MFEASDPFPFFDYFRVPYRVASAAENVGLSHRPAGCGSLRPLAGGAVERALVWPLADGVRAGAAQFSAGGFQLGALTVYARVLPDPVASQLLQAAGGGWSPAAPVSDAHGERVASVWRDERGSVFLPFDPGEAIQTLWSERYQALGGLGAAARAKRTAMHAYYRVRPVLPRPLQIWLRRQFTHVQARTRFPRWPVETALHDLYGFLFDIAEEIAGEPIPWIAPWPSGHTWGLVLTHDVETSVGRDNLKLLQEVEERCGLRSSWNFVPRRYETPDSLVAELRDGGWEVGVHGLYHDGRDLESRAVLEERLPAMREFAERWGAVGFRSPATHRDWRLMPLLGFDYDSSSPDTDPFEPMGGGCCSWLPFFNGELVELPITLAQDHTLFVILRRGDESAWLEKARVLRERGGMALLVTHPDYMLEPRFREAYERFLRWCLEDDTVWHALPQEVSAWWRRRAASHLEPSDGGWKVVGPAADEAAVSLEPPR